MGGNSESRPGMPDVRAAGKIGGEKTKAELGIDHYRAIGRVGAAARRRELEAKILYRPLGPREERHYP